MFKQTELKYKKIKMGYGEGSIYKYGCYLVDLVNGLNKYGWNLTPEGFNETLKENGLWFGPYGNYINVEKLPVILPEMFSGYKRIDPWDNQPDLETILRDGIVTLGRVSAKGIGGTGTHFVLLDGRNRNTAVIHDPWTGKREKVTVRYGKLGNILGLRVFEVRPKPVALPVDKLAQCENRVGYLERTLTDTRRDWNADKQSKENLEKEITAYKGKVDNLSESIRSWQQFLDRLWEMLSPLSKVSLDKTTQAVLGEMKELINKEDQLDDTLKKVKELEDKHSSFVKAVASMIEHPSEDEKSLLQRLQSVLNQGYTEKSPKSTQKEQKNIIIELFALIKSLFQK